jgi:DNA-binding beta-propeller fold protein YncE
MERRRRGLTVLLLVAVGLVLAAVVLLYVTAPSPTVLIVRVSDATTGQPLPGALVQVQARSEQPLPAVTTDDKGEALFRDLPPGSTYVVRVQKIDCDLLLQPKVVVPEEEKTVVAVSLTPHAGGRLYVGLDWARVTEVDTASFLPIRTMRLPDVTQEAVSHLRVHPDQNLLYMIAGGQGYLLDERDGSSLRQLETRGELGSLDLSVDGQTLLAAGAEDDRVSHLFTFDAQTGELLTDTLLLDEGTAPPVLWQPDGTDLYVLLAANRSAWGWGNTQFPWGPAGGIPTGATHQKGVLSADGQYLYMLSMVGAAQAAEAQPLSGTVLYSSTQGLTLTQSMTVTQTMTVTEVVLGIPTGQGMGFPESQPLPQGSSALAASPLRQEVYVLNDNLGTLTVVDPFGLTAPVIMPVGRGPRALTISADGKWAYVANRESRTISVVYLPLAYVVYTIPLDGQPFSLSSR